MGLPYVVLGRWHPANSRSCLPGSTLFSPSLGQAARSRNAGCWVSLLPGEGGDEGLSVFTWEEIKVQLWEVSSALGKRLEGRDEAAAADKASEQFPILRERRAGGIKARCLLGGEQGVRGGQARGPGCGRFGNIFSYNLLLSVSSQFHRVWQRSLRAG